MKNRYEAEITNTIISPPQQQTSTQTWQVQIINWPETKTIWEDISLTMTFSVGNDFAKTLAKTFLEAQKEHINMSFNLQEEWYDAILQKQTEAITNLQDKNYKNEQITEVIDTIISNNKRKEQISSLTKLLEENTNWSNYFDQILQDNKNKQQTTQTWNNNTNIWSWETNEENTNIASGSFNQTRQFFENWQ
jgi:hypothetical protein